jgi:hypothetical protein
VSVKTYDPLCDAKTGWAGVVVAAEAAPTPRSAVPLRTTKPMTARTMPRAGLRWFVTPGARRRRGRGFAASLSAMQIKRSFMLQHVMHHGVALDASRSTGRAVQRGCTAALPATSGQFTGEALGVKWHRWYVPLADPFLGREGANGT